jgi:hypothetical protein
VPVSQFPSFPVSQTQGGWETFLGNELGNRTYTTSKTKSQALLKTPKNTPILPQFFVYLFEVKNNHFATQENNPAQKPKSPPRWAAKRETD